MASSMCSRLGQPYISFLVGGCVMKRTAVLLTILLLLLVIPLSSRAADQVHKVSAATVSSPLSDPAGTPSVLPGTVRWEYDGYCGPADRLDPDGMATAILTFKVTDPQSSGTAPTMQFNLRELKCTNDPHTVQGPDFVEPDLTDPSGKTFIVTKLVAAVAGTQCGSRTIPCTLTRAGDTSGSHGSYDFTVLVAGNTLEGNVLHTRWQKAIQGASVQAVGGKPGVYGYPFTYTFASTDANGYYELDVSEGTWQVTAAKNGFKTQSQVVVSSPAVSCPYYTIPCNPCLGPYTIAEAKSLAGQKVNLEGVCFAQSRGWTPVANVPGLAIRGQNRQWYMCDRNAPGTGILCLMPSGWDWDTPIPESDPGVRPSIGDTVCITATVSQPLGDECSAAISSTDLANCKMLWYLYYKNYGNLGGLPADPVSMTITDILNPANWGKFAKVQGVTVVKQTPPVSGGPTVVTVVDGAGNPASFTVDTQTSTGITSLPLVGSVCSITGAVGREYVYNAGTIRVRQPGDIVSTYTPPAYLPLASVRGLPQGTGVTVGNGIVTYKGSDFIYMEQPDRATGIRVKSAPSYISVLDSIVVSGSLPIEDGEKVITPSQPIIVLSSGNSLPALINLRTRDVGGSEYGPNDPGVSNSRGALNVGLRVKVSGMVTARDMSVNPSWFYVWDGSTAVDSSGWPYPLDDGTGHKGVRIASSFACAPWTDWVEVTGVVSTDEATVSGKVIPEIIPTETPAKITAFSTVQSPVVEQEPPFHTDGGFYSGWNLFSLPVAPAGLGDGSESSRKPWDPTLIFGLSPSDLDSHMYRWESVNQSQYTYDSFIEPGGQFGGFVMGDGYWLELAQPLTFSYSGTYATGDQWVGIGVPGTAQLGHPQIHPTELTDVKVYDGAQVLSLNAASQKGVGWLQSTAFWWNSAEQSQYDVAPSDDWPTGGTALQPWQGYTFITYKKNISLIIP